MVSIPSFYTLYNCWFSLIQGIEKLPQYNLPKIKSAKMAAMMMETKTLQFPSYEKYYSSESFSFLSLGGVDTAEDFPFETPLTTSIHPDWPPFIAEYDYQVENGNTPATSEPLPSPALSFEQMSPELDCKSTTDNATPQTFHLFSRLPVELRRCIWSFASQQERNVSIWFNTFVKPEARYDIHPGNNLLTYGTNTPEPDLLYVSREAREVALKHYSLHFGTKHTTTWFTFETRPRIWLNPSCDTVCLTYNFYPRYTSSHYEDFFSKCAKTDMRSLAYNIYQFFSHRGYNSGVNWSKIFRIVDAYGERSSELQEIVLYYDDNEEFTNHSSVRTEFVDLDWGAMDPDCHKIRSLQDVQRDLLREFPAKAEFAEQGRDRERAVAIWGDIQAKAKFMDIKVSIER
ncbi:hypothetical protein ACMFMG_002475 [Clarireedia jacksonii]